MLTALEEDMNRAILAAEDRDLGSLKSGWALTETHHGGRVDDAAVKATGKSLVPSVGVGSALVIGGALTMTPIGLIAAPVVGAALLARLGLGHAQVKHVFKAIAGHQSVNARMVHYTDIEPEAVLPPESLRAHKKVRVYQIAFDNASVVRTHIYWGSRSSASYDFRIYRSNGMSAQGDAWDMALESAKRIKE